MIEIPLESHIFWLNPYGRVLLKVLPPANRNRPATQGFGAQLGAHLRCGWSADMFNGYLVDIHSSLGIISIVTKDNI